MDTLYIDVGSCEVLRDEPYNIRMVLGSCIGLVVYHEYSKVVGAIHILLPKMRDKARSEKRITAFAEPGIKFLLSSMRAYTGDIKDYKAIIAGGADLSNSDYFNIGENNYKLSKEILNKYSIPIIYEDCLGHDPRILEFNADKLTFNISPISQYSYPKEVKFKYDPMRIIKDIKRFYKYLPVPNKTIVEIMTLKRDDLTPEKVEEIMLKDDFVSLNFLKFVNSSYFSPMKKITTLKRAAVFVGVQNVYKFVTNLLVQNMVKKDLHSYSINVHDYKTHILSVALLSEIIAECAGATNYIAYMGGLFHDIGKIILDLYVVNNFDSLNRYEMISFVEDSISSTAHAIVGRLYLEALNIEDRILNAVEYHHYPEHASEHRKLVATVALSNVIIRNFMIGSDQIIQNLPFSSSNEILNMLNITEDDMTYILDNVPMLISIAEEMVI